MSESSVSARSGGIGFLGLLGILFIGLKLTGYINWSWLWVLSPIWGGCGCVLILCFVILVIAAFVNKK